MTQVITPYQPYVDALPTLCARKTCLRDRVPGSQFCRLHLKKSPVLHGNRKKIYNFAKRRYIYFLSCGDRIKIGQTSNIKKRFSVIQMHSSNELVLEACIEGYEQLEHMLHYLFKDDRLHGEWFKKTPRLQEIIELAKRNDLRSIEMEARTCF